MARPGSWGLQVDRPDHDQADLDQQQREHAQPGRAGCLLVLTLVGPIWAVQPISGPRPQCDPTPRSPQEPTSRASGSQSTLVSARHEKSRYARTTAPRPRLPGGALSFMADVLVGPETGSIAENRAAPDSLAHPADTQDRRWRHTRTGHPCASYCAHLGRVPGQRFQILEGAESSFGGEVGRWTLIPEVAHRPASRPGDVIRQGVTVAESHRADKRLARPCSCVFVRLAGYVGCV